ncbi:MAG: Uma2 family endonuclease [Kiritimatiellae bacterium]|nr:Uma2 family endonuclease [Kiritimatiellia bacterium]
MKELAPDKEHRYDWADYRKWSSAQRWEIIGGEAYAMTPAPTPRHQAVVRQLLRKMADYFDAKHCTVWPAPIDLRLSEHDVVQPDIVVVCDDGQVQSTHIEGAPSLVVEILSAASMEHDRVRKMRLYARAGIKEYWVVTPYPPLVEVFVLAGGAYRLDNGYDEEDMLASATFPDLRVALKEVFDFPIDPEERVWVIKEGRPPAYAK